MEKKKMEKKKMEKKNTKTMNSTDMRKYAEQFRINGIVKELEEVHKDGSQLLIPLEYHIPKRLNSESYSIMYSKMFTKIDPYSNIQLGDIIFLGLKQGCGIVYSISHSDASAKYYHIFVTVCSDNGLYRLESMDIDKDIVIRSGGVYRLTPLDEVEIKDHTPEEYEIFSLESIVKLTEKSKKTILQDQIKEIEDGIKDTAKAGQSRYDITKYNVFRDEIREHFEKLGFVFVKYDEGMILTPRYFIQWDEEGELLKHENNV